MPTAESLSSGNLWVIISVAFFGMLTAAMPFFMQWQKSKSDAALRRVTFAREDEVAALAAEAVKVRARELRQINEKQDVIHLLVNSNLTEALQAQHDATSRELVTLLELQDIKRGLGKEPTSESIKGIEVARARLADLRAKLDDRAVNAKLVEGEQKRQQNETTSDKIRASAAATPQAAMPVKVVESASDPVRIKPAT